ncbi:MAG TPA: hypothetical protein VGO97_04970 [Solirubrobacterales bacterium]|nr:hypothetical protein [Solirubrobacterales bacterium]
MNDDYMKGGMSDSRRTAIGFLAIAAIALAVVLAPAGGNALDVAFATVQTIFLAAIAFGLHRLYRSQSFWLSSLSDRDRGILYASASIAMLTIVAKARFDQVGGGGFIWLMTLAACAGAAFYVWRESRRYSF